MLDDKKILLKQIDATAKKLGIDSAVIEKDIYVTKIIHIMSQLEHEHYRLVFQGGTCLAKAHKIIPRMSEDCDFRIEKKSFTESTNCTPSILEENMVFTKSERVSYYKN